MRPKPSVALTVPKVVSRLEISSGVIDVVRPEMMSLLVIGVSIQKDLKNKSKSKSTPFSAVLFVPARQRPGSRILQHV